MGTNYYVRVDVPVCEACNRPLDELDEELHIGKSSFGWHFSLHVIPEMKLINLTSWAKFVKDKKIFNEYGEDISYDDLISTIRDRKGASGSDKSNFNHGFYRDWSDFHKRNSSEFGENGLIRAKIDGRHCVGHPRKGTWDYVAGDFS